MPYIDDVSISNKITRILNNNSTDKAIRKISNIEIREDVEGECSTHGTVIKVIVPRVKDGYSASSEGFIFVQFAVLENAIVAERSLQGKKFANRIVVSEYYDEGLFNNGIL